MIPSSPSSTSNLFSHSVLLSLKYLLPCLSVVKYQLHAIFTMASLLVLLLSFKTHSSNKQPLILPSEIIEGLVSDSILWLIFITYLLFNFLASFPIILSLAFFFISFVISRQKGLSTPQTCPTLLCLPCMYIDFLPPRMPFPPPLPHLTPCLVHLVFLVILKNSLSVFLNPSHTSSSFPRAVICSLFSTPVILSTPILH